MEKGIINSPRQKHTEEIAAPAVPGLPILLLTILLFLGSIVLIVFSCMNIAKHINLRLWIPLLVSAGVYLVIVAPISIAGLKVVKPNEALVLTLFGKYYGTLKEGFYFVNPFVTAVNPTAQAQGRIMSTAAIGGSDKQQQNQIVFPNKAISLKVMTLNNEKQKINDLLGNPIIIGIVVIWRVVNTAKAVFNVDNYMEYLSIQCDSALRNIVRNYPYDSSGDNAEMTLRGSSQEIAEKLKAEIQEKVEVAGLEILEVGITHLAYAPEIAVAMLQRQQAAAIVDARQMIVEGAVGTVEMALERMKEKGIELDEDRKAAMISNLLVVLCGNRDVQPVVNSGAAS